MQKIQRTNEQIGDTNYMQVLVILHLSRIPGHNKHGESDNNRKKLYQRMEKNVAMLLAVNKNQHQTYNAKCGTVVAVEKRSEVSQGYH